MDRDMGTLSMNKIFCFVCTKKLYCICWLQITLVHYFYCGRNNWVMSFALDFTSQSRDFFQFPPVGLLGQWHFFVVRTLQHQGENLETQHNNSVQVKQNSVTVTQPGGYFSILKNKKRQICLSAFYIICHLSLVYEQHVHKINSFQVWTPSFSTCPV